MKDYRRAVLPNNNEANYRKHCQPVDEDGEKKIIGEYEMHGGSLKRYMKKDDDLEHNFDNNVVSNTVQITTVHYEILDQIQNGFGEKELSGKKDKPKQHNPQIKNYDFGLHKYCSDLNN